MERLAWCESLGKSDLPEGYGVFAFQQFDIYHIAVSQSIDFQFIDTCHYQCAHGMGIHAHLAHVERSYGVIAQIQQVVATLCHAHGDSRVAARTVGEKRCLRAW